MFLLLYTASLTSLLHLCVQSYSFMQARWGKFFCISFAHSTISTHAAKEYRNARDAAFIAFLVSLVGIASCLYFVFAEYSLGAICPLCTIVHVVVAITAYTSFSLCRERGVFSLSLGALVDVVVARIGWVLLALSIAFLPVIFFNLPRVHPTYEPEAVRGLAGCLTERGVKMYGLSKCSHCIAQKALFGDALDKLDYVECSGGKCKGIVEGFPTWTLKGKKSLEGQQALADLAKWAGCDWGDKISIK